MKKKKRKIRTAKCKSCKGTGVSRIIDSRNKGATFERNIAIQITKWSGIHCTRVPMSGGWNKTGDITPKKPEEMAKFIFNFELKYQEVWRIAHLFSVNTQLNNKFGPISKWWTQCENDANKSQRIPILVFTKNHEDVYCMFRTKIWKQYGGQRNIKPVMVVNGFRIISWKDFISVPYNVAIKSLETEARKLRGK